jgi:hypothetical protein
MNKLNNNVLLIDVTLHDNTFIYTIHHIIWNKILNELLDEIQDKQIYTLILNDILHNE